jgi:DNA-binding NarL/FixJ family response regulator
MKVVVADASAHERSALRLLFEQERPLPEVVEATTLAALAVELERGCADVVIVDAQFPGLRLAELLPGVRRACPCALVVVLSSRPEDRPRALAAGADAFVCKGDAPEVLLRTLSLTPCPPLV